MGVRVRVRVRVTPTAARELAVARPRSLWQCVDLGEIEVGLGPGLGCG